MSERYARACSGKRHYNSLRRALEAAKASKIAYGIEMNPYACPFHPNKYVVGATHPWDGRTAREEANEAAV